MIKYITFFKKYKAIKNFFNFIYKNFIFTLCRYSVKHVLFSEVFFDTSFFNRGHIFSMWFKSDDQAGQSKQLMLLFYINSVIFVEP
jgi:hypothetical protein